jgi:hypothetical protein
MFSLINRISAAASVSSSFIKRFHVGKLNHIAIATRDLKGQVKVFQNLLGAQISERKVHMLRTAKSSSSSSC